MTLHLASGVQSVPATPGDQRRFYARVVDRLHDNGPGPGTTIEALAVMAVIEAGHRSARTGAAVALSLTADELAAWASSIERLTDRPTAIVERAEP